MEALEREVAQLTRKLPQASNQIQRFGNNAQQAGNKVGNLAGQLKAAVTAVAGFEIGRRIAQVGIDSIEAERRLKALTGVFGEFGQASAIVDDLSKKFGLTRREASKAFSQIYARLRPIGIELKDIESAFAGFNTAARLSGASAQESSAAWLQLSQALGSGVLRGEELNSIFEQTPTVVQAIAKEMGAPIGAIRDLAKEGKITSDIVLRALKRLEKEGVNQLEESLKGPRQQFKNFSNSVETLSNALATTVLPDLSSAISDIGETIRMLEGPIKYISGLIANALSEIRQLVAEITQAPAVAAKADLLRGGTGQNLFNALTFQDPNKGLKELFGAEKFEQLRKDAFDFSRVNGRSFEDTFKDIAGKELDRIIKENAPKTVKLPETKLLPNLNSGTGTVSGKGTAVDTSAAKAAERAAEALQKRLKSLEIENNLKADILGIQEKINAAEAAGDKQLATRLQGDQQILQITASTRQALIGVTDEQERIEILRGSALDIAQQQLEVENQLAGAVKTTADELTKSEQLTKDIYTTITGNLTNSIEGLIAGTKEWGDVLSDILGQLGNMFLQAGFSALGAGLKIPGFAEGGYVTKPTQALIGESGEPEYAIPASKMSGAMERYNAGMRGSAVVDGADSSGDPGMGPMDSSPLQINISGGVTQFGGQEYLRKDQLPSIIAQASKAGETQTLRRLRMSQSTRQKTGI